HTLLSNLNLFFLKELTRRIEKKGVLGDFVECGVYRGGSAGLLAYEASQSRYKRNVWLYDAFQGMPKAHATNDDDYSKSIEGNFIGSEAQTLRILHRLSIPNDQFKIIKGWFKDTLPNAQKTPIALLHIDCDFYDPVKQVLETFYDSVVPGGYVILNDYGSFQGCQLATDEFMAKLEDKAALIQIDQDAYFFQKPNKSQLSQD
ncbi:MAG TPA: TylF/MycF/NovP-related O-methyltransferase, partial [Coleofasciculaceae cyanobacterium]